MNGSKNFKAFYGTLVGAPVALAGTPGCQAWLVCNDDPSNTYSVTIAGQVVNVLPNESMPIPFANDAMSINGTGAYRVISYDDAATCLQMVRTVAMALGTGEVTTAKLATGVLSADADGRGKMAASFFGAGVAASIAHFENDFWTLSAALAKFAADVFDNTFVQKVFATGAFGADVPSRAAFVANFFDAATAADKFAANAIPASKLEAGAAAGGIDGGDAKFSASQAVGALTVCKVPVKLTLTVADAASANNDWTGLVGKHRILGFDATAQAAGDAGNTYQLQTALGVAISDAVAPGAVAGDKASAVSIAAGAGAIVADAAGLRIAHVRVAGSSLAKCDVWLEPVA